MPKNPIPTIFKAITNRHMAALHAFIALGHAQHKDKHNQTPLILAAQCGNSEAVRALLPVSDVHATSFQRTALMHAAQGGHLECLQLLIPHSNVHYKTQDGEQNALMIAAYNGHLDAVKALSLITDVNETCCFGMTALMWACAKNKIDINTVAFLSTITRMDLKQGQQGTPLMYASKRGHLNAVKLLLPHQNLQERMPSGMNALMLAIQYNHMGVARFLMHQALSWSEQKELLVDLNHPHLDKNDTWVFVQQQALSKKEEWALHAILASNATPTSKLKL